MRYVYFSAVLVTIFPVFGQGVAELSITNYRLTGEEVRVSRTVWDFEYRADIVNRSQARTAITASVTSRVPSVQVLRGSLRFPSVPANSQIASNDTILLRVDRSIPFDIANLQWTFSGAEAPLAHAGPSQTVALGNTVILNGSASSSPTGGGALSYSWAFVSRPQGSIASLNNASSVNPTFIADAPGSYTLQLTVTNSVASSRAAVTISTLNSPPVARAGPNQSVALGAVVQLDGSGSSDVDGDPLSHAWTLLSRPAASASILSSVSAVRPTFVADKAGTYTVQLIVNDGKVNSAASTATISTQNSIPVANPGVAQTVNVGTVVQLTGSGSTDVDGDALTYQWSFNSKPPGSLAALSNAVAVNPSFTVDRPGTYVAQLIVHDGKVNSAGVTVTISTNAVQAPTANAGVNQTVKHGASIVLRGSGADPQSLPLTYQWSLTTKPPASSATLTTPATATSGFSADKPGTYVAQLIVNNGYVNSSPATVTITTTNTTPVASPGTNQSAIIGSTVNLNGSTSSDADGDAISYSWTFLSKPSGSGAALSAPSSGSPSFVPDLAGLYVVQLIVRDAFTASEPATVTISVTNRGNVVLPANTTVSLGGTSSFPVSLSAAAPPGGVTIALLSSDPSRVSILPASVFIPQDATVPAVQPQLTGTGLGLVSIAALAGGYSGAQAQARGTGTISFVPAGLTINENETKNITLTLSGPAPAGGITFALTLSNQGVTSIPATATIPATQTTAAIPVTGLRPGTVVLRAAAPELAEATVSLTVNTRDILLPSGITVPPGELVTFPVSLALPAPQATFVSLTSSDPSKVALSVQNLLFNQGQTQPTAQPKVIGMGVGTVTITASAIGLNTAVTTVLNGFSLNFSPANLSISRTVTDNLLLVLSGPPSPGGLNVTLSSSNPAVAAVPQTILIGAGTNTVSVPVTGIGAGSAIISATAPGTGEASADVTVTISGAGSIALPAGTTIMQGQTAPFAVTLSQPAPAGGTTITLSSSDSGTVTISPSALTIVGGQTQPAAQAQITGVGVGPAAITASAPGYSSVSRIVQVNAVPAQIIVFSGANQSVTVGNSFPVPLIAAVRDASGNSVPGAIVTFSAPNAGPGGHFANGQNTATTNASGFATSATFIANGSAGSYTVTASVAGLSGSVAFALTNLFGTSGGDSINISGATVGRDLQAPVTVTLSRPAPAGGLRVDVTSADPIAVLLAGRPADTGRAQISFSINEGLSVVTGIYVHGLQSSGTASIIASASGWNSGTATISMAPSGFVLTGPDPVSKQIVTVGQSSSAVLTVSAARLDASLNFIETQPLRGDTSATVTLANSSPSLGSLAPSSVTLDGGKVSATATFTAALSTSGSTTLTAASPSGFSRPSLGDDTVTATVVAAAVIAPAVTVGENLQTATSIRLTSPAPSGGTVVTISSGDPAKVLLSTSSTAPGLSSISLQIPAGRTVSQEFYVQGLARDGQTTYAVSGASVGSAIGVVTHARSGFVLSGPFGMGADFFTTTGAESIALSVAPARLDANLNFVEAQQLRGGLTVFVTTTSTDTAVGWLAGVPIQFAGGSILGTPEFRPTGAGATTLALTPPPGFAVPASGSALKVTVRAPGMVLSDGLTIGNNLQASATLLIGQTAPPGGLLVTLTSSSPLLSLSAAETDAGSNTVTLTIPAGGTSANYYLQAKASSGEATYTATAPGFAAKSATVKLAPSGVVIVGPLGLGYQMLAPLNGGPQPASVMTAVLDPVTGAFLGIQPLAGGQSLHIPLANSDASIGTVLASVTLTGGSSSAVAEFIPRAPGSARISVETPVGYSVSTFATLFVTVTE